MARPLPCAAVNLSDIDTELFGPAEDEGSGDEPVALLGPGEIRRRATGLGLRPTKKLGQNFLHDANTIRRIVRVAGVGPNDIVLEVGPGLGSLTLGLLAAGAQVTAVEIDPALARALPDVADSRGLADRLTVVTADALRVEALPGPAPTALVANLPYNVAVPVVLTLLERFPTLASGLVLVQAEVAHRLVAAPGSRVYGAPSVKLAWYARAESAGTVARTVFWPVPNVDSELVRFTRRPTPPLAAGIGRADVFAVVEAAFAQRRKTLRAALRGWAGSPEAAGGALAAAGIDPSARGETLDVAAFAALAAARPTRPRGTREDLASPVITRLQ
ncbi:MAG: 16S rRNA (adenine(1518)-N(6)/adenine(1519)-N(6))-dimethyltransferase RsmA [bacterium]